MAAARNDCGQGLKPYLFSQGQAILNRSWILTQDSPGIRQDMDATLTVPGDLVAVMSGEKLSGDKGEALPDGRRYVFAFAWTSRCRPI